MAITPSDIRIYSAERLTDFNDGGGRMSPNVVVDGVDNNLFDDITDFDRLAGRVSLRKLFGQVLSLNDDTLLSAYLFLDTAPADAASDALLFRSGGLSTERAAALADLKFYSGSAVGDPGDLGSLADGTATAASAVVTGFDFADSAVIDARIAGGSWYLVTNTSTGAGCLRRALSRSSFDVTFDAAIPFSGGVHALLISVAPNSNPGVFNAAASRASVSAYGVSSLTATAAAAATSATIDSRWANAAGLADGTVAPTTVEGLGTVGGYAGTQGNVPVLYAADPILIHHTASTTAAAVANLDVVNVARTSLSRLEVVGSDGTVHARFDVNAPAPTGVGCTANLTAGTVTFSDVSGYAQPVTIRHRIEELLQISSIVGVTVNFNRALSREYPSGSKISALMRLGDLQGRIEGGFAQQAWTGAWADVVTGGTPLADFNDTEHPITTTNAGAVEERWAVIFTNTTTYRVIGEALGEITGGSTALDYSPVNPVTGEPYFTLPAAGWGIGWAAGNVWRFNTKGANAPVWALRSVAPSAVGGDDSVTVEFRGYVNV